MAIATIVLVFIIAFTFFVRAGKRKIEETTIAIPEEEDREKPEHSLHKTKEPNTSPTLYQKKGVKSFMIKGIFHRGLDKSYARSFTGMAISEDNVHDQYAVAIVNSRNELLGYTPRNNKRLSDSILTWNEGKAPAWGYLDYDDYLDKWSGQVYIDVGTAEPDLYQDLFRLTEAQEIALNSNTKSKEYYFDLLERDTKIKSLLTHLGNPDGIHYRFPKNIIPSLSKSLEANKDWEALLQLNNYQSLINELSDKFRIKTLERIEMARKHQGI